MYYNIYPKLIKKEFNFVLNQILKTFLKEG